MAGEWVRASKITAYVGIRRSDLDPVLGPSVIGKYGPLLDANTILEPLHVSLQDQGYNATNTPRILVLDVKHYEVSAGLNSIPRATCLMAIGRDADSVANGAAPDLSVAPIHVLDKALATHVTARIYQQERQTYFTGVGDGGDNGGRDSQWVVMFEGDGGDNGGRDSQWVVMFEGQTAAPMWRFNEDASLVLHISHFTSMLTYSSSASGSVAAGSATPASFQIATFPQAISGAGLPFTPQGAVAASLAGGPAAYTDFWGYEVPAGAGAAPPGADAGAPPVAPPGADAGAPPVAPPGADAGAAPGAAPGGAAPAPGGLYPAAGLKGFLRNLANTDQFQWSVFNAADGAVSSNCPVPQGGLLKNNRALYALSKIEPYWSNTEAYAEANKLWTQLRAAVTPNADGSGVDRSKLAGTDAYKLLGFRYGVPLPFYLNDTVLGATSIGKGFAGDIAGATFQELTQASFWDLIANRYAGRYQLAFAPSAEGGLVIPAQPLLAKSWQTVYESEITSWDDDMGNPVPVRGVMLTCDRASVSGAFNAGYTPIAAVYDSCDDGVLVTKMLPEWLWSAYRGVGAGISPERPRMMAAAPSALAAVVGGFGVDRIEPSTQQRTTANKLAKAYWQQEKLRYRSLMVSTRFRYDIAPGSVISCELPCDRYVKQTNLRDNKPSLVTGMVLNMTISVDCEGETASTSYMIGFPRTEAEAQKTSKLFANSHPFWSTVCYGLPWADSVGIRNKLGNNATIST